MAYEIGGRADKYGNRFEQNWTISQLLDVVEEKKEYVIVEAIGEAEQGVDLWVGNSDGSKEGQQCKARSGSSEQWTFGEVNAKGIWDNWAKQLSNPNVQVSLVSPLAFTKLEDLTNRARNTDLADPNLFFNYQIGKSGQETKQLLNSICSVMKIDRDSLEGKKKIINYLSRMHYRQVPDTEQKNLLLSRLDILFSPKAEDVYSRFLDYITEDDIFGKRLDIVEITAFLTRNNISRRQLAYDRTIWSKIKKLNQGYKGSFACLEGGLIDRPVIREAISHVSNGESIVIHGNAGTGKSGCTEGIIQYCDDNSIPYLAIKLDKHVPYGSSDNWGKHLGLPASISHCIDAVSKNRRAVIVLDQLDALHWTRAKSGEAIDVCAQIINEVKNLNIRRVYPISIIFVCRTYEVEHDRSIQVLFEKGNKDDVSWRKIPVGTLGQNEVRGIIGNVYDTMPVKLQQLLAIISNLYIWQHLRERDLCCDGIETTFQLVNKWWSQISSTAAVSGLEADSLEKIKEEIVNFCDKHGRNAVPKTVIHTADPNLEYLKSNGIIVSTEGKISFVHQSLLDCFLSQKMVEKYYDGEDILQIIGDRKQQIPGKRYQVQLFMQQIAVYCPADFLKLGNKLLESDVRYSFKYIFLELLAQLDNPGLDITQYVANKAETDNWGFQFINTVARTNKECVRILRANGSFEKWLSNNYREQVIMLMASIGPEYNNDDISFLEKHCRIEKRENEWLPCFCGDLSEGNDLYFELRLEYVKEHPEIMDTYMDVRNLLINNEARAMQILALMLELSAKNRERFDVVLAEILSLENEKWIPKNYSVVFRYLLPLIPNNITNIAYSDWSEAWFDKKTLERLCVRMLKKAGRVCAKEAPQKLLETYATFIGAGNEIYNELILDAFFYLPIKYADNVLTYLMSNFEANAFEKTSRNGNHLKLACDLVARFSPVCSEETMLKLENAIVSFQPKDMVHLYQSRIKYNRNKDEKNRPVYWPFWGYFQLEMLSVCPTERLSGKAIQLLNVLRRNLDLKNSYYLTSSGHSESDRSPIENKKLSSRAWQSIITNKKLARRKDGRLHPTEGGFIDHSLESFVNSFQLYVADDPNGAIELFLGITKDLLLDSFIEALFSGLTNQSISHVLKGNNIECLVRKFGYDYTSFRAANICRIVEQNAEISWSEFMLDCIEDIALHHNNPEEGKPVVYSNEDKNVKTADMLESNARNCVRGRAARAIASLLWNNKNLMCRYKKTIEHISSDANPMMRYASLWCLEPVLEWDRDWALKQFFKVWRQDYRCIAFHKMRWACCVSFECYREEIIELINNAIDISDLKVEQNVGYTVMELYMLYSEFETLIESYEKLSSNTQKACLEMLMLYFGVEKYREKAKYLLMKYANIDDGKETAFLWRKLFKENLIDLNEDLELLRIIVYSGICKYVFKDFCEYVEERHEQKQYAKLLLQVCESIIISNVNDMEIWGINDTIAKLIIGLYFENADGSSEQSKEIATSCLDLWDLMYEKDLSSAIQLTKKLLEK